MSDQTAWKSQPYSPISSTPHGKPDPQRVGLTRMDPCFEHFCAVCGAGAAFGFGGNFMEGQPGTWACLPHRAEVEKKWRRS